MLNRQHEKKKKKNKIPFKQNMYMLDRQQKNNLKFCGTGENFYKESNKIFLSIIEMVAQFDTIMQEYISRIKDNKIHNHYLGHRYKMN